MAVFISFNCRGLGSHLKLLELLAQLENKIKENNCVIAIQETKIERLSSKHQAVLTRYKMQFIIEPSVKKSGGLLLLVPYNWAIEVIGKNASFILIKNNSTKEVFGTIYLNPSYPSTDTILYFAQIVEKITNEFTIWIGGDFNAIDPLDSTSKVRAGDRRLKRYQEIGDSFNSMGCFDVFKQHNKRLKTLFQKKNNEESRIDYVFSNECDLVERVTTIKTPLSDHYILQLDTFTNKQEPCYVQKH